MRFTAVFKFLIPTISLLLASLTLQAKDLTVIQAFANSGDAKSQYELGLHYQEQKDYQKAFAWIEKAAKQGLQAAQLDLGTLYDVGEGVEKNLKTAAMWYQKAANQGEIAAQYNLGVMFETGEGVSLNLQQAYIWYSIAEVYGYKGVKSSIARLRQALDAKTLEKADAAIISIVNRINQSKTAQQAL